MSSPWKNNLIDLTVVRRRLSAPTGLMVWLMEQSGTLVVSSAPGKVRAQTPDGQVLEVMVRSINVFEREARLYLEKGLPVPPAVLEDVERWEVENGRKR